MKKLLFVRGFSESVQSANTLCMEALAKALNSMNDIRVDFVWDGISEEQKNPLDRHNIVQYFTKFWYWPSYDKKNILSCYSGIKSKLEKDRYDAIVVGHMPYDAVAATIKIKKDFPVIKTVLYELDPINYEMEKRFSGLRRFASFKRIPAEKRAYQSFDVLIKMISNEKQYLKNCYRKYDEKTLYLDIPLIEERKADDQVGKQSESSKINLIYAGRVNSDYRSPSYLLRLLVLLSKKMEYKADFFARGNCVEEIIETSNTCGNIQIHDYVTAEKLEEIMNNADCLLSIGNKYSDMLPSKILSYISTGRPIIHIKTQKKDICESYLDKYPMALIILENEDIESAVKKVYEFINNSHHKQLIQKDIISLYPMNSPEYSAKKIRAALNL